MIRFDDLSFTQIAVRLNFCNLNYFSTAFKRCTGMTPKEFVADSHKQKSSSNT